MTSHLSVFNLGKRERTEKTVEMSQPEQQDQSQTQDAAAQASPNRAVPPPQVPPGSPHRSRKDRHARIDRSALVVARLILA